MWESSSSETPSNSGRLFRRPGSTRSSPRVRGESTPAGRSAHSKHDRAARHRDRLRRSRQPDTLRPTRPYLRMSGVDYVRTGEGDPLLLVHGLGGDRSTWTPVMDSLAAGFDVIAPDLPGFGASPPLPEDDDAHSAGPRRGAGGAARRAGDRVRPRRRQLARRLDRAGAGADGTRAHRHHPVRRRHVVEGAGTAPRAADPPVRRGDRSAPRPGDGAGLRAAAPVERLRGPPRAGASRGRRADGAPPTSPRRATRRPTARCAPTTFAAPPTSTSR